MSTVYGIFILITVHLLMVTAFQEEAIFEDEDIYSRALPPLPYTGMTVPGTKWCGPGNTSSSYDDLGRYRDTDICCRAHDHCPDVIEPGNANHNLFNPDMFPRLLCDCEQAFLNCLQNINEFTSNTVGRAYFSARSRCFKETYPGSQCTEYQQGTFGKRCIKYKLDTKAAKQWQFFDIPFYTTKN